MTKVKEIIPNEFHLPDRIKRLGEFAYNLWWVWNPESQRVFSWIRPTLWERVNHNPVKLLRQVSPECLQDAAENEDYLRVYDKWLSEFDAYMANHDTWCTQECSEVDKGTDWLFFL